MSCNTVWWWWTLTVSFLGSSLCPLILNEALLDKVILVVSPRFSSLWIFLANPFWPAKFLLRNQLMVLWQLPCRLLTAFLLLLLRYTFVLNLLHFNYVFWCGPLWGHLVWDSLCFLDLSVNIEVLTRIIRQGEKEHPTVKEQVKLSVFAEDMILDVEN